MSELGDHPDKLCDHCLFDKGCFPVTLMTLGRFRNLCKNKAGETPCKWFDDTWKRVWKEFADSVTGAPYP